MSVVGHLVAACLRAGVQLRTGHRVRELLMADGAVAGVTAGSGDGTVSIRGRHVMLASGGYEFNPALVREWVGTNLEGAWSCPGNEGDGLVMAMSAGCGLSWMGEAQWYALLRLADVEMEGAPLFADASPARNLPGSIIVDRHGRRFANESTLFQDFGRALADLRQDRRPAWLVMDARFLNSYRETCFGDRPLAPPHWLAADTLAELAPLIGVAPEALTQTVEEFNASAADGIDPAFGRTAPVKSTSTHGPATPLPLNWETRGSMQLVSMPAARAPPAGPAWTARRGSSATTGNRSAACMPPATSPRDCSVTPLRRAGRRSGRG